VPLQVKTGRKKEGRRAVPLRVAWGEWKRFVFEEIPGVFINVVREGVIVVIVVSQLDVVNWEIFFSKQVAGLAGNFVEIGAFAVADVNGDGNFALGSSDDSVVFL